MSAVHNFLFTVYPYICLAVFFMGSLARFDRDQYTWKSDSSQLLRSGQLRWGSNLFHAGILFLFFGHLFGQLTPHAVYGLVMTSSPATAPTWPSSSSCGCSWSSACRRCRPRCTM